MITAEVRRAALGIFPAGTPLVIVAPETAAFAGLLRERNDPAVVSCALQPEMQLAARPYMLLEGIDAIDEPAPFLRSLRTALPGTRLFALIANGAHLPGLGAFFGGLPLAPAHPYTPTDIETLLVTAGWTPLDMLALADDTLPAASAAPLAVTAGAMTFHCADAATLERGRTAAFLAVGESR
jgi:hypothetical protein